MVEEKKLQSFQRLRSWFCIRYLERFQVWSVEGSFSCFQWKSSEVHRNMCSEMGQFFVFCNVTGVDFLRIYPRKIGSFCPPIKEKKCFVLLYLLQDSTLPWTCVLHRKSILRRVQHSLPLGELTCFFWVLLLRDTAEMQIIVCVLLSLPLTWLLVSCCLFMSPFLTVLLYSNSILICLFKIIIPQFTILNKNSLPWHQFLISLTFATY